MPIRRTRMIGGERFIEKHHRQHENILRIMEKIQEDQKLVNLSVMMLKADRNKLKRIKEEKNKLLREATEAYKNRNK